MLTFEDIVKTIESLPPLSHASIGIQHLYTNGAENVDIFRLVKLIESDALLTANVLKMINAPYYGFSRKIASVSQAVTLFGTEIIYGIVMNYSIHEKLTANLRAYGVSNSKFNDICHLQSALMMQWYSRVDLRHAQFLSPLALIMETGKLIVADEVTKSSYIKEFRTGLINADDIAEYEHDLFGTTSYFVSGLLFEHWNLEPLYVEMLKGLDFERANIGKRMEYYIDTLDVVRTAVNVKEVLTKDSIENASVIVKDMGLEVDEFERIARRIKTSYAKKSALKL